MDLKSHDSSEGADPLWDSECFKKEADYWDKIIEPTNAATMAPMPGHFIEAMNTADVPEFTPTPRGQDDFRTKHKTEMCKKWE